MSVIDATCPLVSKVHAEARRFAREGYTVALIGHAGHEEVEGTLGEAPDSTVLVQTAADVAALDVDDPSKVAYLMQTTLAIDEAADVAGALRDKFPQMRAPGTDDICYATTNRQAAVRAVAAEADLVLVAGSANSSNSVRLVERSERAGTPAHLIDGATDIDLSWLSGASVVGLTAGASAPPAVVSEIIDGPVRPRHRDGDGAGHHDGIGPVRPAPRGPPLTAQPAVLDRWRCRNDGGWQCRSIFLMPSDWSLSRGCFAACAQELFRNRASMLTGADVAPGFDRAPLARRLRAASCHPGGDPRNPRCAGRSPRSEYS